MAAILLALFPTWWRPLTLGQVLAALESRDPLFEVEKRLEGQAREVLTIALKGPLPYGPDIRAIRDEIHWVDGFKVDVEDLEAIEGDWFVYSMKGILCSSSLIGGLWSDGDVVVWIFDRRDGTIVAWWIQYGYK